MTDFKLPELGENIYEAQVIRVLVSEGDEIKAEQNVLEIESEKAATGLPCPVAGRVAKIHVKEGDTIKVGQTLLSLEEMKAGKEAPAQKSPQRDGAKKKEPAKRDEA